jgi:hypothetical protein
MNKRQRKKAMKKSMELWAKKDPALLPYHYGYTYPTKVMLKGSANQYLKYLIV